MKNNKCCKICTVCHVGCHSKCLSYQAWRSEHLEEMRQVKCEKAKDERFEDYKAQSIYKMKNSRATNGMNIGRRKK